jgi:hypothetical protein
MAGRAAILNSRQPLRPCGLTDWVVKTVAAVNWVKEQKLTLCSSIGMQTWELVTALASIEQIPLRLILPSSPHHAINTDDLMHQFDLMRDCVEIITPSDSAPHAKEDALLQRDRRVLEDADLLIPISVRPGGHMAEMLATARKSGKEVIEDFQAGGSAKSHSLALHLDQDAINPELNSLSSRYIIHWTRTPHGAWPGERMIDYYSSLIHSTEFPRSAFATLRHIAATRLLKASSRHMPENIPTVAFSSLKPRDVIPLMKWRARYAEMSFEPYGIGIHEAVADKLGMLPVKYYEGKITEELAREVWRSQSVGRQTDWRQECEYRHLGDLSLANDPSDALMLFCRNQHEADSLQEELGISSVSLFIE